MSRRVDILVVKDFSRFSRHNSRGLVELEDLRDADARIISIGNIIDYPTYDDWTATQFQFLVNELPVCFCRRQPMPRNFWEIAEKCQKQF